MLVVVGGSEEKRNVLRFLLSLADTGGATEATDFGSRRIQLPALLHNRVSESGCYILVVSLLSRGSI